VGEGWQGGSGGNLDKFHATVLCATFFRAVIGDGARHAKAFRFQAALWDGASGAPKTEEARFSESVALCSIPPVSSVCPSMRIFRSG